MSINSMTNQAYVTGGFGNAVSVVSGAVLGPGLGFFPVAPCRVVDTRGAAGPLGGPSVGAGIASVRSFPLPA